MDANMPRCRRPEMTETRLIHASAAAFDGQGVLITGASGCGKSALTLQLIAIGAVLIADDQILLTKSGDTIQAESPPSIAGLIEARGIGLIRTEYQSAPIQLVVDLGRVETKRLPPIRHTILFDLRRPLVLGPLTPHLPGTVRLLLKGGRLDPENSRAASS